MNTTTAAETNALAEVQSLSLPDMTIMNRGAVGALRMAQSFVIATDDDYQLAGEELGSIKSRINKIQIGVKKKKLETLEARLNAIVSPELRRKLELDAIAAELT